MVCGSRIGFRALVSPLLNILHQTRSIPILVSYIISYIDRKAIMYIERDIGSILAAKQRINRWWWLNLQAPPKIQVLTTFSLRPAARITLFRPRAPLRNGLTIRGIGPVRVP